MDGSYVAYQIMHTEMRILRMRMNNVCFILSALFGTHRWSFWIRFEFSQVSAISLLLLSSTKYEIIPNVSDVRKWKLWSWGFAFLRTTHRSELRYEQFFSCYLSWNLCAFNVVSRIQKEILRIIKRESIKFTQHRWTWKSNWQFDNWNNML